MKSVVKELSYAVDGNFGNPGRIADAGSRLDDFPLSVIATPGVSGHHTFRHRTGVVHYLYLIFELTIG